MFDNHMIRQLLFGQQIVLKTEDVYTSNITIKNYGTFTIEKGTFICISYSLRWFKSIFGEKTYGFRIVNLPKKYTINRDSLKFILLNSVYEVCTYDTYKNPYISDNIPDIIPLCVHNRSRELKNLMRIYNKDIEYYFTRFRDKVLAYYDKYNKTEKQGNRNE